jgi:heterodisulfide reductase subunit B
VLVQVLALCQINLLRTLGINTSDIEVHPGCLTFKLADTYSVTTKGSVKLRVCKQAREMKVPMHIVDNLIYSIV